MNGTIGFFDSGIGGYTILAAVRKLLPQYDYVYYGDTLNVPYGNRTEEEVFTLTRTGIETLFAHGARLVIIACNTASAETLRKLQDSFIPHVYDNRRILGVIIPTVEAILDMHSQNVLLIGTKRTVDSHKYERELAERNYSGYYEAVATPELVPLLEQQQFEKAMAYLDGVMGVGAGKADTLVLGCTHYVLLKEHIRNRYSNLNVIAQDEIIPHKIFGYLERHPEIQTTLGTRGTLEIILTNDNPGYRQKLTDIVV